jgi:hypothetical protein
MQPDNEGYHIVAEGGIRQREAIGGVDEGDLLRVVMMGKKMQVVTAKCFLGAGRSFGKVYLFNGEFLLCHKCKKNYIAM